MDAKRRRKRRRPTGNQRSRPAHRSRFARPATPRGSRCPHADRRARAAPPRPDRTGAGGRGRLPGLRPLRGLGRGAGGGVAGTGAGERRRPDRLRGAAGPRRLGHGAGDAPVRHRPRRAERGGDPGARLAAPGLRGADRRAGARASRPPRLLRAALLHRPRRSRRRGSVLGRDDALPAARGPDPGRLDVRQRRAAAHGNHGRGPPVPRRAVRAERRHRDPRAGEDGAHWPPGPRGLRSARRRDRDHARRPDRAARRRDAGRRAGRGRDRRRRTLAITAARVGRG